MPVGNDVVDLRDPGNQPAAIHPRFDNRVFSAGELSRIAQSESEHARHVVRWTLWAAKESAFKLVRRTNPAVPFRPRTFVVRLTGEDSAVVEFEASTIPVSLDVTDERVHAVAWSEPGARPLSEVDQPAQPPVGREASRLARALAARAVGERLGISAADVRIEGRVPRAVRDGLELPVQLSLSHDGRFLAHAMRGPAD